MPGLGPACVTEACRRRAGWQINVQCCAADRRV